MENKTDGGKKLINVIGVKKSDANESTKIPSVQQHPWSELDNDDNNINRDQRNWFEKCWKTRLSLTWWDLCVILIGLIAVFIAFRMDEMVNDESNINNKENIYTQAVVLLYSVTIVLIVALRILILIFRRLILFTIKVLDPSHRSPTSLIIQSVDPTVFHVIHFILTAILYNTIILTGNYNSTVNSNTIWDAKEKSVRYLTNAISTILLWTIIWFLGDLAILYFSVVAFKTKAAALIELITKVDLLGRIGRSDYENASIFSYLKNKKNFEENLDFKEHLDVIKKSYISKNRLEETYINPSNIGFWELYRCVNLVRHSPFILYVHGERILITKHYQLHTAAESIYGDICEQCGSIETTVDVMLLDEANLRKIFNNDDYKFFMSIVDIGRSGIITRQKFLHGYHGLFSHKKAMEKSISQHEGVADVVAQMVRTVFFIVFLIGFLLIIGVNPSDFLLSAATVLASLAFVFGNSLKNFFDSIVFVFAQAPFSIGDRIKLTTFRSEQTLIVKKINTMVTSFDTATNERVFIPNFYLAQQIIINHHRSPPACFYIPFQLSATIPSSVTYAFIKAIQEFMRSKSSEWVANETCVFWEDFQPGHYIKIGIWAQHTSPWYLWKVVFSSKAELISFCLKWLSSYGIGYCLPEQPVAVREFDALQQGGETFEEPKKIVGGSNERLLKKNGKNSTKHNEYYDEQSDTDEEISNEGNIINKLYNKEQENDKSNQLQSENKQKKKKKIYKEENENENIHNINQYYTENLPSSLLAQLRKRIPGSVTHSNINTLISQSAGVYSPFDFPQPTSAPEMAGLKT